nr:unnamed protein product [Hydra vulgaris]
LISDEQIKAMEIEKTGEEKRETSAVSVWYKTGEKVYDRILLMFEKNSWNTLIGSLLEVESNLTITCEKIAVRVTSLDLKYRNDFLLGIIQAEILAQSKQIVGYIAHVLKSFVTVDSARMKILIHFCIMECTSWQFLAHCHPNKAATSSPQQIPNVNFGDILLTPQQKLALKNGEDMGGSNLNSKGYSIANGNNLRWTDAIIPYKIDCSIENLPDAVEAVTKAMAEWENKTCIRFVKHTNEKYFLEFFRNTHCWGNVGMTSYTKISVGDGCEYQHVNTHEIGHVVGFYHEQNRVDRDQWIKIHWENIAQFKDAFDIVKETSSLGVDYDYASIMHYPWNAFSSNGKDTITPIKPLNGKTPYIELSKDDIEQVSRMYNCPAIEKKRALAKKSKYFGDVRERRNANGK